MGKGWKSGRIEEILISLICVWLGWKHGKMRKMSLYKFTYKPLIIIIIIIIIYAQLKQKSGKQSTPKKKEDNHSNLLKNINHA